jgi:phosphonate transport system substrate-binding protein
MNHHFSKAFSRRVRITGTILALVAVTAAWWIATQTEPPSDHSAVTLQVVGLDRPIQNRLHERFTDADGDLVADPPANAADLLNPETLTFAYIPSGEENARLQQTWQGFLAFLSNRIGTPVTYLQLASQEEQLEALKEGRLHLAGLNAGNVPVAVNDCGFIPLCTIGRETGIAGYAMQIIVPPESAMQSVADLKGRTLALTQVGSNSGFKAPLVLLMQDFGLQVERDYYIQFSRGHDLSIQGIATKQFEAAAVASDLLERAIARGDISADDARIIYTSERFAPSAFGTLHTLAPDLVADIRQAFLDFEWDGTALAAEFASAEVDRFVPVEYKNDWAIVRRIDDAIGTRRVVNSKGTD